MSAQHNEVNWMIYWASFKDERYEMDMLHLQRFFYPAMKMMSFKRTIKLWTFPLYFSASSSPSLLSVVSNWIQCSSQNVKVPSQISTVECEVKVHLLCFEYSQKRARKEIEKIVEHDWMDIQRRKFQFYKNERSFVHMLSLCMDACDEALLHFSKRECIEAIFESTFFIFACLLGWRGRFLCNLISNALSHSLTHACPLLASDIWLWFQKYYSPQMIYLKNN